MAQPFFSSRDPRYKQPFGAVPCGTTLHFTLRLPLGEYTACHLVFCCEFSGETALFPLLPSGEEADCLLFSGSCQAPETPELIWYSFRLERKDGSTLCLGKNGLCREQDLLSWQQTVYDDSRLPPDWFGRGVTYQIFPDRFYRTHIPDPAGMPGDRRVHLNWEEDVDYLPSPSGEILNRDFFGGNLEGIRKKLPYLRELGVTTLYFCPIFTADSNHRYNTGDYLSIDPMLGNEEDFRRLCDSAHGLGMRVMLDGVFNHTGSGSLYFNATGEYPSLGAAQSKDSPYYSWYNFLRWPDEYDSWWGIRTLPAVNEMHPDYRRFIISGEDSVIRRWLRLGADAWRLDVADELPDEFIAEIRSVMEQEKPDSFLLGEVWEDGSNKISYHRRRKYLLGAETHGLMNYPFRVGALAFLLGGSAEDFAEVMESLRENYPRPAFFSSMNMLGTHDTPRILTLLGTSPSPPPQTRTQRANFRLNDQQLRRGLSLLRLGMILLYAFPGSPTVFYGDEAGMEGFEDPFNRGTFPWGRENRSLQRWVARLGQLRGERESLQCGEIRWLYAREHALAFARETGEEITVAAVNAGETAVTLTLPWSAPLAADSLTGQQFLAENGTVTFTLPPREGVLLI